MRYDGRTAKRWDKADNAGPVTEADLAVNACLADILRSARPDHGWLSEESEDSVERLSKDHVFIVDPIDGTRSFADGSNTWAHSLAIAHQGVVEAAVIYLPRRDKLYAAALGRGATLNGASITPSQTSEPEGARLLATRKALDSARWHGTTPNFDRGHRPSLAYRMALVAEGRFDAMLTVFPAWEWDIAAGDLILREAGATVTTPAGDPLRFNNPTPRQAGVLACGPALHQALLPRLRAG